MLYILQSCRNMKTYFLIINIIQILQSNIMLVIYSCLYMKPQFHFFPMVSMYMHEHVQSQAHYIGEYS